MPYSVVADLLLDDLRLKPDFPKQKFVDQAAEEMDSKLGFRFALPLRLEGELVPSPTTWLALPPHQVLLLKTINNRLASGRLILSIAVGGEQTSLHAYGYSLVQAALIDLMMVANGDVIFDTALLVPTTPFESKAPAGTNHDEESLLLGFENSVMRDRPWYSRPGAL